MGATPVELLQGTLDLLVLKTLAWGPTHGYGVARWIQQITDDVLTVEEGSLYPALHRLEKRGLVKSSWGLSENKRRAKYYEITRTGRETLSRETLSWSVYSAAVDKVLGSPRQPVWAK
jgi:PadR family transcriptional regulator, regulatory protein PadR